MDGGTSQDTEVMRRRAARRVDDADSQLVERLRAGEATAATDLATAYGPRIRQQALRYVGTLEDAEEVAQDVLLKVWRRLERFRGDAALSSWIHRITFNTSMSFLRRRRRPRRFELTALPVPHGGADAATPEWADWSSIADELLLRRQMQLRFRQALASMPVIYRVPVQLRDLEGLTLEEASVRLNLNKQTLKSRIHRGRKYLRRRLADFADGLALHRQPDVRVYPRIGRRRAASSRIAIEEVPA
jgi:RNA polymerase sigma-70 factor, ECF subfamily